MGRLEMDPFAFSHATLVDVATEGELEEFLPKGFVLPGDCHANQQRLMESPIEVIQPPTKIPGDRAVMQSGKGKDNDGVLLRALDILTEDVLQFRYWNHFRDFRAVVEGVANYYFGGIHDPPGIISVNPKGVFFAHPRDYFKHVYLRHPKDIASANPKYSLPGFGGKIVGVRFLDKLPASARPLDPLQGLLKRRV
jgi:hypothetical protein